MMFSLVWCDPLWPRSRPGRSRARVLDISSQIFSDEFKPGPSDDVDVRHHGHVLVLEVVAMHDVPATVAIESNQHFDNLARTDVHRVFPAGVDRSRWSAVAPEHLEVAEMDVYRVMEVGGERPHPEAHDVAG